MLASTYHTTSEEQGSLMHRERGFFGILTITRDSDGFHSLTHGHILHGMQHFEPESDRREALTYYYRTGPIGQVFEAIIEPNHKEHVAVVGLGTGTLASYGEPGQEFTFYEINPAVERIARNPAYFTYLQDCRARCQVVLGDARLSLDKADDHYYDLIAVDAFSSDAIPVHLLTREAVELYFRKLREGGILALHISNRYLDLEPVARDIARDLGLLCRVQSDDSRTEEEKEKGKSTSTWAILVRQETDLGPLDADTRWRPPRDTPGPAPWTDDFSNILGVFQWK
jgi:SAM-dependent methyltransferase